LIALSDLILSLFLVMLKACQSNIVGLSVHLDLSAVLVFGRKTAGFFIHTHRIGSDMHVVVLNAERFSYCVVSRPPSREHLRLFFVHFLSWAILVMYDQLAALPWAALA
jgi:hypothetical protein